MISVEIIAQMRSSLRLLLVGDGMILLYADCVALRIGWMRAEEKKRGN